MIQHKDLDDPQTRAVRLDFTMVLCTLRESVVVSSATTAAHGLSDDGLAAELAGAFLRYLDVRRSRTRL